MSRKKILIIINSLRRGGAEKILASLINTLHNDLEVHLFMFNTKQIEFDIPEGIIIQQLGKPTSSPAGPLDVIKLPFYALRIKRYLVKHDIKLVFSFLNRPNFIAGYLKLFGYKGKTIINERTNTSYYYTTKTLGGRLGRSLVKRLYAKADLVITNSGFSKKDLQETYGLSNEIISINNGINTEQIRQAIQNAVPPFIKQPGEFIFCHIGRYHPDKNQSMLVNAFSMISDKNCRLLVIGKGIPEGLGPLVTELGLAEKVILKDLQHDVWPWYLVSDAFVLTSNVEGFPNVLLEAMACGLPVISTDCRWGPREILAPGTDYPATALSNTEWAENGALVACDAAAMLAAAMAELLDDEAVRRNYRQHAETTSQAFNETAAIGAFKSLIMGRLT